MGEDAGCAPTKIDLQAALAKLPFPATDEWPLGVWDIEMFAYNGLTLSLFAPKRTDFQTTHEKHEVYIVVSGTGELTVARRRYEFGPGDALYVPAGVKHGFTRFSADLVSWVVFFEPELGRTES